MSSEVPQSGSAKPGGPVTGPPDRTRFSATAMPLLLFLILVTLPTLWVALGPDTTVETSLGTLLASLAIGLIGAVFLRREGATLGDIGLNRAAWYESLVLFAVWWILTTLSDLVAGGVGRALGTPLSAMAPLRWNAETLLRWAALWIGVGFGEEIAFRGYLHNKLAVLTKRPLTGIAVAAMLFGLWHIPGGLLQGNRNLASLLGNAAVLALFGFTFFHFPYEKTRLLPYLALFHGWNDFPVMLSLRHPTFVGFLAGYVLFFAVPFFRGRIFGRFRENRARS